MLQPLNSHEFSAVSKEITNKIAQNNMGNFECSIANPFVHELVERNYRKIFKSEPAAVMGVFNDFGQRSDDFIKDHSDKLHVLYAGCSYTYAEGVPIDLSWSYLVNEYINQNVAKTSGYFNVGKGGANLKTIENQIAGYMAYSGKPDIIFINLPDIGRENLEYHTQLRGINDTENNSGGNIVTIKRIKERLYNLIIWCNLLSIKLFIGSWNLNMENHAKLVNDFGDPFYNFDIINLSGTGKYVFGTTTPESNDDVIAEQQVVDSVGIHSPLIKIMHFALDDAHPGLVGHRKMANKFIDAIVKSGIDHKK